MKIVGIIAEYNPFHNGHAYQIREAKKQTGADYVIVVMSGNYVQRGTPAITDKFSRAAVALKNGADIVFELPVIWATASAESFAMAGITLLDCLGIVDYVSFGCESENFSLLASVAEILVREPEEFSVMLAELLKEGLTFPAARARALSAYITKYTAIAADDLIDVLSTPNNILAIEYCKALYTRKSKIQPCPVLRTGAGYHTTDLHNNFSSASALRKLLLSTEDSSIKSEFLTQNMPVSSASDYVRADKTFLSEKDFSSMLYYKLFMEQENGYESYGNASPFLSNRIRNLLGSYMDFNSFCSLIKTKDVTHTRIQRLLLHILLDIRETDYITGQKLDYIPWLRLLGFRKEASFLLKEIQSHSELPLITRPAKAIQLLSESAYTLYRKDIQASNLYYGTLAQKKNTLEKNEFQRECVRV